MSLPPARVRTRKAPANDTDGPRKIAGGTSLSFSTSGEAALKSAQSQVIEDPFTTNYQMVGGALAIIQPPYNIQALQNLPHENSMLRQCIEAMVVNTEGHGYRLEYTGPEGEEDSDGAKAEKKKLERFLKNPNPDCSFDETRARIRRDLETTGNGAFEVLRTQGTGEVCVVGHIPFSTLRLTAIDKTPTPIEVVVADEDGTFETIKMQKRFRRFVQRSGTNTVYFKEFGDPRNIRSDNGKEDNTCPPEMLATEVFHQSIYAPGTVYGVPRWINQLPAVLGSRQAELTNLDFFKENAIPALAVLVSGGRLTRDSLEEIEQHLSAARGRQSMNRVVVMEAIGDANAGSEDGIIPPPKVDIKPLAGERQKDGFFLLYGDDCDKKIRSSFRLPPIFVGQSEDYTHATAKSSYEVGESQVFGPARRSSDDIFNQHILSTYRPIYWSLRSNPPRISDPSEIIAAITCFAELGALSSNQVIDLANEYFDLELPKIDADWGDYPFDIVKLLAAEGTLKGIEEIQEVPPPPTIVGGTHNIDPKTGKPVAAPGVAAAQATAAGAAGAAGGKGKVITPPGVLNDPKAPSDAGLKGMDPDALERAFEVIRFAAKGVAMRTYADTLPDADLPADQVPATVSVKVGA